MLTGLFSPLTFFVYVYFENQSVNFCSVDDDDHVISFYFKDEVLRVSELRVAATPDFQS